jgi:hypothetical protein
MTLYGSYFPKRRPNAQECLTMKDRYNTLAKTGKTEIVIKKSRFVTSVSPVTSEEKRPLRQQS